MNIAIYEKLKEVARAKDLTNYTEVGRLADLDMSTDVGRIRIAQLLDEINQYEDSEGRPIISALVKLKNAEMPGSGFFVCAQGLGKYQGGDDLAFWIQEVKRVHNYWQNH